MKSKLLFSLFLGSALGLSAQGFKDGVEYYRADQPEEAATRPEPTNPPLIIISARLH